MKDDISKNRAGIASIVILRQPLTLHQTHMGTLFQAAPGITSSQVKSFTFLVSKRNGKSNDQGNG